jgi:hypothetical protein
VSFNPYEDKPIEQGPVKLCCKCTFDVRKHVKKRVTGKFGTEFVDKEMYWCLRCGYPLSLHDIDIMEAKLRGEIL